MIDCISFYWDKIISNSGLATWVMYSVLAGIGLYGLKQIRLIHLQTISQTYTFLFTILYTREMIQTKDFLHHSQVEACLKQLGDRLRGRFEQPNDHEWLKNEYESFKKDIDSLGLELQKELGFKDPCTYRDIDRLLTAYNHVGLMIERKILTLDSLPNMTHGNILDVYWTRLEPYIELRRKKAKNKDYACHFEYWMNEVKSRNPSDEKK